MIFVTVGTHEDQFNRLIQEIDRLQESGVISEEVFIQTGYSDYLPTQAEHATIIDYQQMDMLMKAARIVITHGGPGSITHALRYKKIPIVVPRQKSLGEHVDDHQVLFAQRLEQIGKVIMILDINCLETAISKYDKLVEDIDAEVDNPNNLERFVAELDRITKRLLNLN
ncbi:MAG: glycosyltransferase [Firmicutes bacterium]|nr:glycosyltransferase [Bacillota bacterium]